jgi:hypothetical protein
MPNFSYTPGASTISDPSALTEGWHPAFFMSVKDEETPESWASYQASPRSWRWIFAVWEHPDTLKAGAAPELQSVMSTQKFSPPPANPMSKFQASKAYLFVKALIGRDVQPGEAINLESLVPIPCLVNVSRTDKNLNETAWALVTELRAWPQGQALRSPELVAHLQQWYAMKTQGAQGGGSAPVVTAPTAPTAPTPPPPAPVPAWGVAQAAPAAPAAPATPATPAAPHTLGW